MGSGSPGGISSAHDKSFGREYGSCPGGLDKSDDASLTLGELVRKVPSGLVVDPVADELTERKLLLFPTNVSIKVT